MQIDLITSVTPELQSAVRRLIPQLTSRNPPKEDDLVALVQSDSSSLVVARESGSPIAGMACVSVYRVPTGVRAIIEDVVVDGPARGKGIGESLIRRCLEIARAKGAEAVTLTSNPRREAANRLYVRIGFRPRETNSYIYAFS
ncbi:MAG TPA: GNAT family N-acetyltransferase [Anaerolineales bacterium]